jgi:Putative Zn-dependent protease, contains TPR repeats
LKANSFPLIALLIGAWIIRSKMAPPAEQADKLAGEGKSAEALPLYEKALEKNPDDARALLGSSTCYLSLAQPEKALAGLDRVLKIEPTNVRAMALKSACLSDSRRYDEAVDTATKAIQLDTAESTALPHLVLSISLNELGRFEEALSAVNKYLLKEPENAQALFIKGSVLEELERYDEALDTFSKAARSRDGHIRGCIARGILLCTLGRMDEGIAEFNKVLPQEPSIRAEELAKLKVLLNESATKYDEAGRPEKAERLQVAATRIS